MATSFLAAVDTGPFRVGDMIAIVDRDLPVTVAAIDAQAGTMTVVGFHLNAQCYVEEWWLHRAIANYATCTITILARFEDLLRQRAAIVAERAVRS